MILYHGTTRKLAEAIQREGLKIRPDLAFDLWNEHSGHKLRDMEKPSVCVTLRRDIAIEFARFRVEYERAPSGASFSGWGPSSLKLADRVDKHATPALVTFQVPDDWELIEDTRSNPDMLNYCGQQPIPARYIVKVERLPMAKPDMFPAYLPY